MRRASRFSLQRIASAMLGLFLVAGTTSSPARAEGVHAEVDAAATGLIGLGDLGKVSGPSVGGEVGLHLLRGTRGFGARAAGGVRLLQGHTMPTGEVIFNGTGTQDGKFEAKQSIWWVAIGPTWSRPFGPGRMDLHFMLGQATAKASSGLGWANTLGSDPGSSSIAFVQAGGVWLPPSDHFEFGIEVVVGGSGRFWDDPPVTLDSAGNHVLQGRSASYTGLVLRVGYRLSGS